MSDIKYFHKELVRRFIKDHKLPFDIPPTVEEFELYLDLFEADYKSRSRWELLTSDITNHFDSSVEAYFEACKDAMNRMVFDLRSDSTYQFKLIKDFANIKRYCESSSKPGNIRKELFKIDNVDKDYMSVDLKEANFQVLQYIETNVLDGCASFKDFVSRYTPSEYIQTNKGFREAMIGQIENRLQGPIIRLLTSRIWESVKVGLNITDNRPFFIITDEVAVELAGIFNFTDEKIYRPFNDGLQSGMIVRLESLGVRVKAEIFRLKGFRLLVNRNDAVAATFFQRLRLDSSCEMELKCVPRQYGKIVNRMMLGQQPTEADMMFNYEESRARFSETYRIVRVNPDGTNGEVVFDMDNLSE